MRREDTVGRALATTILLLALQLTPLAEPPTRRQRWQRRPKKDGPEPMPDDCACGVRASVELIETNRGRVWKVECSAEDCPAEYVALQRLEAALKLWNKRVRIEKEDAAIKRSAEFFGRRCHHWRMDALGAWHIGTRPSELKPFETACGMLLAMPCGMPSEVCPICSDWATRHDEASPPSVPKRQAPPEVWGLRWVFSDGLMHVTRGKLSDDSVQCECTGALASADTCKIRGVEICLPCGDIWDGECERFFKMATAEGLEARERT